MDYHALTKKCDGMCDSCECPPANTDPTLKPNRTADWYMDVLWPLLPVPGEFDGMDACDQLRWRSVVRLAIEYVLCGERGTPPSSKKPHCPKGDGPCIRGCKGWECRDGWPDDPTLKPDIAALKKRLADDSAFEAQVTGDRPPTPVGWSDTDWLKHLEEIRQDQETYHRGPLPETGWD